MHKFWGSFNTRKQIAVMSPDAQHLRLIFCGRSRNANILSRHFRKSFLRWSKRRGFMSKQSEIGRDIKALRESQGHSQEWAALESNLSVT